MLDHQNTRTHLHQSSRKYREAIRRAELRDAHQMHALDLMDEIDEQIRRGMEPDLFDDDDHLEPDAQLRLIPADNTTWWDDLRELGAKLPGEEGYEPHER